MPGVKGKSGGKRIGAGRIQQRFKVSAPAAIFLKTETQARLQRTEVTVEEVTATLKSILQQHARSLAIPEPE